MSNNPYSMDFPLLLFRLGLSAHSETSYHPRGLPGFGDIGLKCMDGGDRSGLYGATS